MKLQTEKQVEKKNEEVENVKYKSQKHKLLLYPDNATHVEALKKLNENYEIAYILHDKDDSKPHWHVLIKTKNQTYNTALAKSLGIDIKWIRNVPDFSQFARYLVHKDDKDKYQYDISDVHGNLTGKVKECCNVDKEKSEDEKAMSGLEFLEKSDGIVTLKEFMRWMIENGMYDVLRRNSAYWIAMIREHNEEIKMMVENQKQEEREKRQRQNELDGVNILETNIGKFLGYSHLYKNMRSKGIYEVHVSKQVINGVTMPIGMVFNIQQVKEMTEIEE